MPFPLHFSLSPCPSLPFVSCNYASVDYQMWHKRLGHPNSNVLRDLLKSSFLGNKESPSLSAVQFDCISCKLGKSKILSFQTHKSNVGQPFYMIYSDLWGMALVRSHGKFTSILSFLLMTIVNSYGSIFHTLNKKCSLL